MKSEGRAANRLANVEKIAAKRRAETHCLHGHEFSPENTYIKKGGGRTCRTCARERSRDSIIRAFGQRVARRQEELELEVQRQHRRAEFWKARALAA